MITKEIIILREDDDDYLATLAEDGDFIEED